MGTERGLVSDTHCSLWIADSVSTVGVTAAWNPLSVKYMATISNYTNVGAH